MRGLVRMLIMFGPLILRQVQKFQRNKQRQQPSIPAPQRGNRPQQRHQETEHKQYKDLNKELGRDGKGRAVSAEERDFHLKEEEIMLSKEELKDYKANSGRVDKLDPEDITTTTKKSKKNSEGSEYDEFFEN